MSRSRDLMFFYSVLILDGKSKLVYIMVSSKFQNAKFLEFTGKKFESNQFFR